MIKSRKTASGVEEGEARALPLRGGRGMDDIARRLDDLLQAMAEVSPAEPASGSVGADKLEAARRKRLERQERERVFGSAIFGDHGWWILLDLFIAFEEGRDVTVFTLCRDVPVPEAAVLRCVATLIEAQLVLRKSQASDPRRISLALTDRGLAMMCDYFNRVAAIPGAAAA